jgi:hypothetical protein
MTLGSFGGDRNERLTRASTSDTAWMPRDARRGAADARRSRGPTVHEIREAFCQRTRQVHPDRPRPPCCSPATAGARTPAHSESRPRTQALRVTVRFDEFVRASDAAGFRPGTGAPVDRMAVHRRVVKCRRACDADRRRHIRRSLHSSWLNGATPSIASLASPRVPPLTHGR